MVLPLQQMLYAPGLHRVFIPDCVLCFTVYLTQIVGISKHIEKNIIFGTYFMCFQVIFSTCRLRHGGIIEFMKTGKYERTLTKNV